VAVPDWIWYVFIFAFGCCVGSFLNVVVYRLPRDESLVKPPSSCPCCSRHIRFYDNVPLISWLLLRGRCRYCKARISARYFVIELLTGLVFLGLFVLYFRSEWRLGMVAFSEGGWLIYALSLVLAGGLIAASAIDLELWVIPISVCWLVTGAALLASAVGGYIIDPAQIRHSSLLPAASAKTGALAAGAAAGLVISLLLVATGLIKRSYESEAEDDLSGKEDKDCPQDTNHRTEMCREVVFLLPVIASALAAYVVLCKSAAISTWWVDLLQKPFVSGLLGSLWGYFVGCGIVWATRILGTLGFGKEAMGLGDVHLMGAAGAVVGPLLVVAAFFIAPFFGLAWAAVQMLFRKTRQIPYGPFLSLGVLAAIILHNRLLDYWFFLRYHNGFGV
jgi:leader peptidase (prepilin peptidase)/N-methyltransferase